MFVKPIAGIGGSEEPARKDTDIQARSENAPSLFLQKRKWQFVVKRFAVFGWQCGSVFIGIKNNHDVNSNSRGTSMEVLGFRNLHSPKIEMGSSLERLQP